MQNKKIKTGLVWFRNDLRIRDNNSLYQATQACEKVIAVYFLDPRHFIEDRFGFRKTEKFRAQFLLETLIDLKQALEGNNIDLLVYMDQPENHMGSLCKTYNIESIYLQKEWTAEELDVAEAVKQKIPQNISWIEIYDQFLFHPDDVDIPFSKIPEVFTVFRKKLEKYVAIRPEVLPTKMPAENRIQNNTSVPTIDKLGLEQPIPQKNTAFPFDGGATKGLERLHNYFFETKKLGVYKKTRNGLIGADYSSKFSPWLANGSLSTRTIYWQVKAFEKEFFKNQSTYWLIFELIWRDYFKYISLKHGNQIFQLEGILKKDYYWSQDSKQIEKWINGETNSDFVNANMIELKQTGWMSNRGRQNVASYFAKELELDWRIGAAYFESVLLDYDVHSNYGNWMYVAGVGNDPRDRKFNVELQAERYDTSGKFRRLWLQTSLF
jgi:deoxyribodipyrimidine photo-lyase